MHFFYHFYANCGQRKETTFKTNLKHWLAKLPISKIPMRLLQRHIALELQSIEDWSIPTFCPNPLSSGRIIWLWYATELFLMHCNGLILWLQWHHSTINMWSHLHRCNSFVLPRFDDFSFYQCYWSGSQLKATFLNKTLMCITCPPE